MAPYSPLAYWLVDPANRDKALDITAKITQGPREPFTGNGDVLHKFGILKKSFDVSKYVDHSLLDDAVARIK